MYSEEQTKIRNEREPRPSSEQQLQPRKLAGRRFALREVRPDDYPFLYSLAVAPELAYRWRFRETQPTYETFVQTLGSGVLCQYLILNADQTRKIGLVVCYHANLKNRHAYIAVQGVPDARCTGILIDAATAFLTHLFETFNFLKVYAECPGWNLPQFRSQLGSGFVQEGCLQQHEYFAGRFWDHHIVAVYRDTFESRPTRPGEKHATLCTPSDGSGLPLDEFIHLICLSLDRDHDHVSPTDDLAFDLGFDSLEFYEMLIVIEDELGVVLGQDTLASAKTLEDVYFFYLQHLGQSR